MIHLIAESRDENLRNSMFRAIINIVEHGL
jgi:hypothetical protein